MFTDFGFAIMALFFGLYGVVAGLKDKIAESEAGQEQHTGDFWEVLNDEWFTFVISGYFFVKFFVFALVYRHLGRGNVLEDTQKFWISRNCCDLILYGLFAYMIYSDRLLNQNEKSGDKSNNDDYYFWLHTCMLVLLIVKEYVFLLFFGVFRANSKLDIERRYSDTSSQNLLKNGKQNQNGADDIDNDDGFNRAH